MLGIVVLFSVLISLVFSFINGNVGMLGEAIIEGASSAVTLTLSLMGMMCLWGGIMRVLSESGASERLARLLSPVFSRVFKEAYRTGVGKKEVCTSVCANMLGIGNAATPLALSAMGKLDKVNEKKGSASDDMIALAVLNSSCFCLIPTTVIAMRTAAGSDAPSEITAAVWICSGAGAVLSCVLCRLCSRVVKGRRGGR